MTKTEVNDAPFAYDGLDRVIHEKARLGLMTSLMVHPKARRSPISGSSAG